MEFSVFNHFMFMEYSCFFRFISIEARGLMFTAATVCASIHLKYLGITILVFRFCIDLA